MRRVNCIINNFNSITFYFDKDIVDLIIMHGHKAKARDSAEDDQCQLTVGHMLAIQDSLVLHLVLMVVKYSFLLLCL